MDIKDKIIKWNSTFPLDYWYRQKYKIPFNSNKHRSVRVFDILFEYKEGVVMDEIISSTKGRKEEEENYINNGTWYKGVDLSDEEIEDIYDSINLEELK